MTPNPQDSAVALEVEREAPPNNLPDWSECAMRVANSDFIAKRVAEGGYGPEADSKLATELHRFIYEYDDADRFRSAWFLHRLELLLNETRRASQSDGTSGGWQPIATAPKDGTRVLAWSNSYGARETYWRLYGDGSIAKQEFLAGHGPSGAWEWSEPQNRWAASWSPTHWQPLAAAPHQSQGENHVG